MSLKIYEDEQGSEAWLEQRRGIVTASVIDALITRSTVKPANNESARRLIFKLACERITGRVADTYTSRAMMRGILDEPIAREYYEQHHAPVTQVGLMVLERDGVRLGYSSDGLVGDHGAVEFKSREPEIHVATILQNEPPAENVAQLQTAIYVAGLEWIDYCSFSSGLPLWTKRVYPDPKWQAAIPKAVKQAEDRITETIQRFRDTTKHCPPTEYVDHFGDMEIQL